MRRQMPEEGSIRARQAKLNRAVIQLTNAFDRISKLQTVEIGEVVAVDVVPWMVAVKDALEGENHVIRVEFTGWRKPWGVLKSDVIAQAEAVCCAVIHYLPAFGKLRDQPIGVRIDVEQAIVELRGQRINNQAAPRFCGLKVSTCPLTQ